MTPEQFSTLKEAPLELKTTVNNIDKSNPQNWTAEQRKSIAYARRLARESKPISGTLAEPYLHEHRGIHLHPLPKDLRFHPGIHSKINAGIHPALLAIARNKDNQVQAVQAIYLNEATANKSEVEVVKQTWGVLADSSVDLSPDKNKAHSAVYLAEGVETALSILQSLKQGQVKAILGKSNFAHSNIPKQTEHVVLCLDNDGVNLKSEALIHKAVTALTEQNKTVWIAQPTAIGKDYNDLLKDISSDAVKANLEKAIPFTDYRDAIPQTTTTLSTTLQAFEKNNLLLDIQLDASKKFLDFYLNRVDAQPAKSIDIPPLGQTEKIKEMEIEL